MSEWIKLHSGVFRHPKTLRLARLLHVSPNCAVGELAALWTWTLEYAPTGDLSKYDVEEVAIAVGCADGFMDAAVAAGYLDKTESGLTVHDWDDYAGALIDARERNAERMRKARATNVHSTCDARAGLEKKEKKERKNACADANDGSTSSAHAKETGTHGVKDLADQVLKAVTA